MKTQERMDEIERVWAEVVRTLGLNGNPYRAKHLWVICNCCDEPTVFGKIIAWNCPQDDGGFKPGCQVLDQSDQHWFVAFDGPSCVLWRVDEDDTQDVEEREVVPIFARCAHKPIPAA